MNKKILIIHSVIFCCIVCGFLWYQWIWRCDVVGSYTYRTFCDSVVDKREYSQLGDTIRNALQANIAKGNITRMGVYFRDLSLGPTLSINADGTFAPASLLKLPLAMAYFKVKEKNIGNVDGLPLFSRHLAFRGSLDVNTIIQAYKPAETLLPDTPYTIGDLIRRMLVYSDNAAYEGLLNFLQKEFPEEDYLLETYHDLGLIAPDNGLQEDLSPRLYGGLLRQLYAATYLPRDDSEEILAMLRESDFFDGLRAGVPRNIEVADKFGERQFGVNGKWEIHDCGIVYYPRNPYLLCVMGEGKNSQSITRVIAEISNMVYEEFDSRKLP
jgi:beta-lactamase class A